MQSSTRIPSDYFCLSPALLAREMAAAEKLLLAHVGQRARLQQGACSDSNNELSQALGMKAKTVSDLINRLATTNQLSIAVDKLQSGKRLLQPSAEWMAAPPVFPEAWPIYPPGKPEGVMEVNDSPPEKPAVQLTSPPVFPEAYGQRHDTLPEKPEGTAVNSHTPPEKPEVVLRGGPVFPEGGSRYLPEKPEGYSQRSDSPPEKPEDYLRPHSSMSNNLDHIHRRPGKTTTIGHRPCLITGVDISQQQQDVHYVDQATLLALARHHPPTFQALFERFLPGETPDPAQLNSHSKRIARAVRDLAASGQPFEPLNLPPRLCPVTGVDLSHQSLRKEIVSMSTLTSMYMNDRLQFDQLVTRFLSEAQRVGGMKLLSERLFKRVERLAQQMDASNQ